MKDPVFTFNGDWDELSYPFIYEKSALCDFEILTDELCTLTGLAISACSPRDADVARFLAQVQPLIFDLNGSIRGRCTVDEETVLLAKQLLADCRAWLPPGESAFVLPRGRGAVIPLHAARSLSKKVVRALVAVKRQGTEVPEALPRFTNVLTNLYFQLTRVINARDGEETPVYESANYPGVTRAFRRGVSAN